MKWKTIAAEAIIIAERALGFQLGELEGTPSESQVRKDLSKIEIFKALVGKQAEAIANQRKD